MFRPLWVAQLAILCLLGQAAKLPQTLHSAIVDGNLAAVQQLLAGGLNPDEPDTAGSTPLMLAVLTRQYDIAEFLLQHGADANVRQSQSGSTALRYAVLQDRPNLVRTLLAHHANPNLTYPDGETALHLASERSSAAVVELLCAARTRQDARDANGNTPLDEAVLRGRIPSVAILLHYKAAANAVRAGDGRGPVHEACIQGHARLIPMLVQAGADPTLKDRSGQTPLDLALDYGNLDAAQALLLLAAGNQALDANFAFAMEAAVVRGRTARVALLLGAGFSATRVTPEGSHYLNDAALKDQLNVARLLLDHGARPEDRNQSGGTALHDAAIAGDPALIDLLLDRGASIDARETDTGATPLMLAASMSRTPAVSLLLARGADPALTDNTGRTALMRARDARQPDLLKLLENAGAKPTARTARAT